MIASNDISQEILAIHMLTTIQSSLNHNRIVCYYMETISLVGEVCCEHWKKVRNSTIYKNNRKIMENSIPLSGINMSL